MPKVSPSKSSLEAKRTCLYEILGLEKSASQDQIKRAYRVRALQCHPDKNPSAEAKLNFQKLVSAYNVLKDEEARKLYDETGYIEGDGFDKAADFFRTKFGRISEQDIEDFAGKYKMSDDEIADVKDYYVKNEGNVADLLEWIPLSEPQEVDRFLAIIDQLISEKALPSFAKYKSSIAKLRRNALKLEKEQAKFTKDENREDLNTLVLAIQEKRRQVSESFLDDLISKYAHPKKKAKK